MMPGVAGTGKKRRPIPPGGVGVGAARPGYPNRLETPMIVTGDQEERRREHGRFGSSPRAPARHMAFRICG